MKTSGFPRVLRQCLWESLRLSAVLRTWDRRPSGHGHDVGER
jgi:hypothetical protein